MKFTKDVEYNPGGEEWHGELRNKKKNGELYCESMSISPMIEPAGNITHFIAVSEDITEKRMLDDQLMIQRDLAQSLAVATSLDVALPICLEIAIKVSGMDSGSVYIADPQTGDFALACSWGLSLPFIDTIKHWSTESDSGKIVLEGMPVYTVNSKISSLETREVLGEGLKAAAVIPFLHQGK